MDHSVVFRYAQVQALVAKISAINAEVEGMKAANMERISDGLALAYPESSFVEAASELEKVGAALQAL